MGGSRDPLFKEVDMVMGQSAGREVDGAPEPRHGPGEVAPGGADGAQDKRRSRTPWTALRGKAHGKNLGAYLDGEGEHGRVLAVHLALQGDAALDEARQQILDASDLRLERGKLCAGVVIVGHHGRWDAAVGADGHCEGSRRGHGEDP